MSAADADRLRDHVQALEGPRHPAAAPRGLAAAEEYVARSLDALGLDVRRRPFRYGEQVFRNVVGVLEGAERIDSRILVGAHFDAVRGSPGADDNASGVAALLEAARLLSKRGPRRTVEFVGFNLEEPQGFLEHRIGSRHYARQARRDGVTYRACLVLEMVGYTEATSGRQKVPPLLFWKDVPEVGDFLAVVSDWGSRELVRRYREAAAAAAPDLKTVGFRSPLRGWLLPVTRLSDHSRFWDEGYPAVMLTDTAFLRNPHYHRGTDRIGTLDFTFLRRVTAATAEAVARLAAA